MSQFDPNLLPGQAGLGNRRLFGENPGDQLDVGAKTRFLRYRPIRNDNLVNDTECIYVGDARSKVLIIEVTQTISWVGAGQATIQPYVGLMGYYAGDTVFTGTTSQLDIYHTLIGVQAPFGGASTTTIGAGIYYFSPSTPGFADLEWCNYFLGFEFTFPGVPSPIWQVWPFLVLSGA